MALNPAGLPRSVPLLAWPLALVGMAGIRYIKRLITETSARPRNAEQILIFGAGWVGSALALRMVRDPSRRSIPSASWTTTRPSATSSYTECGSAADSTIYLRAAERLSATRVLVAVNSADAALIRKVSDAAAEAGIGCHGASPAYRAAVSLAAEALVAA